MKNIIYLLLATTLVTSACEDVIELEVPEGRTRLIVDGLITNAHDTQTVKLNFSSPYFSEQPLPPASDALVVISDDTGRKDTLEETAAGLYQKAFQGEIGRSYSLFIKTAEGAEYQSSPQKMEAAGSLDTIYYEFREANSFNPEEGYFVEIKCSDIAGQDNYYRWRYFVNGEFKNEARDLIFTSDQLIDGFQKVSIPFRRHLLQAGDVARVEQMSVSEEAYEFLNLLNSQVNSGGSQFGTPPAPVMGNVKGLAEEGEYALGFFMVSAVQSKEIKIVPLEE